MLRREFIISSTLSLPILSCGNLMNKDNDKLFFKIGLAQWSFNKALKAGNIDNLDFVKVAKEKFL